MKKIFSILIALTLLIAGASAQTLRYNGKTLGVLGGLGPAASADFMRLLVQKAPATKDQEHPRVILLSNPQVPDRSTYITGGGENPEPYLVDGLRKLSSWGADYLAVTCNTAHYYINHFRYDIDKPIIHIVEETIRAARESSAEGAWLTATIGTIKVGIFQKEAEKSGYALTVPDDEIQQMVQKSIFLYKAGKLKESGDLMKKACKKLWKIKKMPIVAACTEIPLAYEQAGLPADMIVSSLDALAEACIKVLYSPAE